MKKKRTARTLACLVVGLLVLTGSAYANYDNANGYTMYKDGLKKLFYVENFSATAEMSLEQNGKTIDSSNMEYQYDRNGNPSQYSKYTYSSGGIYENWTQDGNTINYNGKDYSSYEAYNKGFNDDFLSSSKEDRKMAEKMINFTELLGDTFVGDLKNNFVLVSKDDGNQTYQIDLSGQQIPAYVNAGLGLMFGSYAYHDENYVPTYVTFSDEFDFDAVTDEEQDAYMDQGHAKIEENGGQGIALVNADGTIDYFKTEEAFRDAVGSEEAFGTDVFDLMGTDPVIDSVSCLVTFDSEGRILENRIEGTMTGQDKNGKTNTLTLKMNVKMFDYGTTKIDKADLTGKDVEKN